MIKLLFLVSVTFTLLIGCMQNDKNTGQNIINNNNVNVSEDEGYIDRNSTGIFIDDELSHELPDVSDNTSQENPFNF